MLNTETNLLGEEAQGQVTSTVDVLGHLRVVRMLSVYYLLHSL